MSGFAERIAELRLAAGQVLAPPSAASIALRLSRWSSRWLDRSDPFRTEAEERLPASSGFSLPMVRRALDETFGALVQPALARLAGVVAGPRVTLLVAAGAIPDPTVRSVYRALLGRSAVLVKTASAEPVLPGLLERSLAAVDPLLGRCFAALGWPGGDRAVEDEVLPAVDRVVAYGSDEAIADLSARVPAGVAFAGRGHRQSVAVVGASALVGPEALEDLGRRISRDVALYDQEGCLSPQAVYVQTGGLAGPAELAERVAHHLARAALALPAGPLAPARALSIHEERARVELAGGTVLGAPDLAWTVSLEPALVYRPSPGHRFLRVHAFEDVEAVREALARCPLQAVAIAPQALEAEVSSPGVRVCPVGTLQTPPVEWLER